MSKPFRTRVLDGRELAGFIKERQFGQVKALREQGVTPKLVILRDSDNPVITKYTSLKVKYGTDIGITVEDRLTPTTKLSKTIDDLNNDPSVSAIIIQLPLTDPSLTDDIVGKITPTKDVDNLGGHAPYTPATAEAIDWLLTGYDIDFKNKHIAIVGQGRLVGAPLAQLWRQSGRAVATFTRGDDLTKLANFDIIVTGTGVPALITSNLVKSGAVVVDAGTASDHGVIKGDVADDVRARADLFAVTPVIGGVGPLTVSVLFDHVITATSVA